MNESWWHFKKYNVTKSKQYIQLWKKFWDHIKYFRYLQLCVLKSLKIMNRTKSERKKDESMSIWESKVEYKKNTLWFYSWMLNILGKMALLKEKVLHPCPKHNTAILQHPLISFSQKIATRKSHLTQVAKNQKAWWLKG